MRWGKDKDSLRSAPVVFYDFYDPFSLLIFLLLLPPRYSFPLLVFLFDIVGVVTRRATDSEAEIESDFFSALSLFFPLSSHPQRATILASFP